MKLTVELFGHDVKLYGNPGMIRTLVEANRNDSAAAVADPDPFDPIPMPKRKYRRVNETVRTKVFIQ